MRPAVDDVIEAAVADEQPAVGITDHGNMYGVLDFYKACRERGVKPIIGMEAYMAGESRASSGRPAEAAWTTRAVRPRVARSSTTT